MVLIFSHSTFSSILYTCSRFICIQSVSQNKNEATNGTNCTHSYKPHTVFTEYSPMNGGDNGVRGFPLFCLLYSPPATLRLQSVNPNILSLPEPSWKHRAWVMEGEYVKYTGKNHNEGNQSKRLNP